MKHGVPSDLCQYARLIQKPFTGRYTLSTKKTKNKAYA